VSSSGENISEVEPRDAGLDCGYSRRSELGGRRCVVYKMVVCRWRWWPGSVLRQCQTGEGRDVDEERFLPAKAAKGLGELAQV
jgi:hypothetical protein